MIEELLPAVVVVDAIRGDDPTARLLPEEAAVVARAVPRRRQEFALGRTCARRALMRLGLNEAPLLCGPSREPRWPVDVVGSITHCEGYCAAAVAKRRDIVSVGIDAEVHEALPQAIVDLVCLPQERARMADAPRGVHWDRVVFSAKESVYKAYFPIARAFLEFHQVELTFDTEGRTFDARILGEAMVVDGCRVDTLVGRYGIRDGWVLTAIAVLA